ncbi:hypothetical protein [Lentilactobacillus otakiensis]|mgnify:CR=1 FL=1|uniref:Uncharacterized protein n=1 Tax=Lentilactobacillus otakiensis DSM 19908 = JCM 15040 TaxID=1423780 RepID=S4PPP7_9LACO|nr:hypothetical protein [Lentilactobacillus otakiensis]MBZ3776178.1 hypothetical protein [Lentilactobacillus otakiensis]MDV3517185.1 hypothetical protein [Lentilactobacillus otakiensis]GAD16575.1 hypothetical protein LOT_1113 [Lentilactobacillus otakiensis DSM 19908 = JCM 15040]
MIITLLMILLFGYLLINLSWLFVKASVWLVLLMVGFFIVSKLLLVGLIVAAVYAVYVFIQRSQMQPYKNRH